jgi:hypothetical protein
MSTKNNGLNRKEIEAEVLAMTESIKNNHKRRAAREALRKVVRKNLNG